LPAFSTPGGHRRFRLSDLNVFIAHSRVPTEQPSRPLVLVIDDDEARCAVVRFGLEADGCAVRTAPTADEALQALEEAAPQLVLLNVLVGRVDGREVVDRLRGHGVDATAVLMYSGVGRGPSAGDQPSSIDPAPLVDAARRVLASGSATP
jgi:PleD family two-component response regulator